MPLPTVATDIALFSEKQVVFGALGAGFAVACIFAQVHAHTIT